MSYRYNRDDNNTSNEPSPSTNVVEVESDDASNDYVAHIMHASDEVPPWPMIWTAPSESTENTPQVSIGRATAPETPRPRRTRPRTAREPAHAAAFTGHPNCMFKVFSDAPSRVSREHWTPYEARVNVLSGTTTVPCDLLSLTRQRVQMTTLTQSLNEVFTELCSEFPRAGLPNTLGHVTAQQPRLSLASISTSPECNVIGEHGTLDAALMRCVRPGWWERLTRDANESECLAKHVEQVIDMIMAMRCGMQSVGYVLRAGRELQIAETELTRQMYPKTLDDVEFLLRKHSIGNPRTGIRVPSLGDSEVEFCTVCRSGVDDTNEDSKHFVRIQPRCSTHTRCVRSGVQNKRCSCSASVYFHFDCMKRFLLAQYVGANNDGVGRSEAICPACRGTFCFTDLVEVHVDRSLASGVKRKVPDTPIAEDNPAKVRSSLRTGRKRAVAQQEK